MKPIKLKVLILGGTAALGSLAFNPASSDAQGTTYAASTLKYSKEKADINNDLSRIEAQRARINDLQTQCKKYKKSGNESALAVTKKELTKAKADLSRDQAYLRADKADLVADYNLAIRERKSELKKDKTALKERQSKLDESLVRGDDVTASKQAAEVAQYNREIKNDQLAIQNEKRDKNTDLLAINKRIEKSNGESLATLYTENAIASVRNINFNKLPR